MSLVSQRDKDRWRTQGNCYTTFGISYIIHTSNIDSLVFNSKKALHKKVSGFFLFYLINLKL